MTTLARSIGLIVNPIAGMGGSVGLKGTDGVDVLARARFLGAKPIAQTRATRALRKLATADADIIVCPGAMGEDAVRAAGLAHRALSVRPGPVTTAQDTRAAARELSALGVSLVLFAGGDGTARDILEAVGDAVPILGIPSGVKMHSAVFAVSPEAAGQLAVLVVQDRDGRIAYREAEVMDVDEEAVRAGRLSARLFGYARVPFERTLLQGAKAGGMPEDAALDGVTAEIARELEPGVTYLFGPGSTTKRILGHLALDGTLLGVDAVRDGKIVGKDLRGCEVAALANGGPLKIVVSVVGGQGFIFGRGNQQIGPRVIRGVGRDNIIVVASQAKLLALAGNRLLVDTGNPSVDRLLAGFIRVRIGPKRSTLMRVEA